MSTKEEDKGDSVMSVRVDACEGEGRIWLYEIGGGISSFCFPLALLVGSTDGRATTGGATGSMIADSVLGRGGDPRRSRSRSGSSTIVTFLILGRVDELP